MIKGNNSVTLMTSYPDIIAQCQIAEHAGRLSHDSVSKMTPESYGDFLNHLIKLGHTSVLEHITISFLIETSISASREIIRHRHCAFTEKSTRYCDFSEEIDVVYDVEDFGVELLENVKDFISLQYKAGKSFGLPNDTIREMLPLMTGTKLEMTTNLREWAHFIKLRETKAAHPVVRDIARQIKSSLQEIVPWVFEKETKNEVY